MSQRLARFCQSLIALGLATYLAEKYTSGRLAYYINLRFADLTLLSIIVLTLIAATGLASLASEQALIATAGRAGRPPLSITLGRAVFFVFPVLLALLSLPTLLTLAAFAGVSLMGLMPLFYPSPTHSPESQQPTGTTTWAMALLAIPLILGLVVPARPLSTASLNARGLSLSVPANQVKPALPAAHVSADRTILDWIKAFNYQDDLSPYLGQPASVTGFVYHDPRLPGGQFMVARFAVTCCVVDAFAIGLVVDWPASASLTDNAWVAVKGPIDVITLEGKRVPVIHAQTVAPVEAPSQPYVYP